MSACPQINVLELLTKPRVRLMKRGDVLPEGVGLGFNLLGQVDTQWCWIYEAWGEIRGVLLASPCHGTAFLWRFWVDQGSDKMAAYALLKRFERDCRKRGVLGYLTLVDLSTATGKQLKSIVERCGGVEHGLVTLMAAPIRREKT